MEDNNKLKKLENGEKKIKINYINVIMIILVYCIPDQEEKGTHYIRRYIGKNGEERNCKRRNENPKRQRQQHYHMQHARCKRNNVRF